MAVSCLFDKNLFFIVEYSVHNFGMALKFTLLFIFFKLTFLKFMFLRIGLRPAGRLLAKSYPRLESRISVISAFPMKTVCFCIFGE